MYVVINSECDTIPERAKLLNSEGDALLNFLLALNYDPGHLPIADLLRQYHGLKGEWLILSPIHWVATHNDVMIVAQGKDLKLKESEVLSWFNLFTKYFEEEGKVLHYHNAETWLISDDKTHDLNAKPVRHLLNRSLMPELSQLDNTMYWQKFFTESQMLFASKPNQTLMNGLWVWGGTKLKEKLEIKICTDQTFFSIAKICSSDVTLYSPQAVLKDYEILLINEFLMLSEQHREELKEIPGHWYWNDSAYIMPRTSRFTRLWRKLIHVD